LILAAGWLFLFWSLFLRAFFRLGELPHPRSGSPFTHDYVLSNLDPKTFPLHDMAVWWFLSIAMLLSGGIAVAVLATGVLRGSWPGWRTVCAWAVCIGGVLATILCDPLQAWTWFID
jgi:hypothetical protein